MPQKYPSMEPTLRAGDRILACSRRFAELRRGDIVFYSTPNRYDPHVPRVKRIVGMPGEKIEINNGRIFVDSHPINPFAGMVSGPASTVNFGPVDIPKAHYFLLGDNLGNSADSREYGPVDRSRIMYKALLLYRPFNRFQILL